MDELRRLRELLAMFPTPWKMDESFTDSGGRYTGIESNAHMAFEDVSGSRGVHRDDAALIVAAVNALPKLLAIAEAYYAAATGEFEGFTKSMQAGGSTDVTYRVLDQCYSAPRTVRLVRVAGEKE